MQLAKTIPTSWTQTFQFVDSAYHWLVDCIDRVTTGFLAMTMVFTNFVYDDLCFSILRLFLIVLNETDYFKYFNCIFYHRKIFIFRYSVIFISLFLSPSPLSLSMMVTNTSWYMYFICALQHYIYTILVAIHHQNF